MYCFARPDLASADFYAVLFQLVGNGVAVATIFIGKLTRAFFVLIGSDDLSDFFLAEVFLDLSYLFYNNFAVFGNIGSCRLDRYGFLGIIVSLGSVPARCLWTISLSSDL